MKMRYSVSSAGILLQECPKRLVNGRYKYDINIRDNTVITRHSRQTRRKAHEVEEPHKTRAYVTCQQDCKRINKPHRLLPAPLPCRVS